MGANNAARGCCTDGEAGARGGERLVCRPGLREVSDDNREVGRGAVPRRNEIFGGRVTAAVMEI